MSVRGLRLAFLSLGIAGILASQATTAASSFDSMVIVPSDAALVAAGKTRAEYNRQNPKAEREWRAAWAAEGTAKDSRVFAGIRRNTTKPSTKE